MKKIILWVFAVILGIAVLAFGYVCLAYVRMSPVTQGSVIPEYGAQKSALLVIDIQEGTTGTLSKSKGLIEQGEGLIKSVNSAIELARALGMPIVYIRQENTDKIFNVICGGVLAQGTKSADIDSRVVVASSNIFAKQKMDAFSNPKLDAYLRANSINRLYVTGLDAAYCVDRTIKGALGRKYAITVLKDAVMSSTIGKRDKMLAEYVKEGVTLMTTEEFLKEAI